MRASSRLKQLPSKQGQQSHVAVHSRLRQLQAQLQACRRLPLPHWAMTSSVSSFISPSHGCARREQRSSTKK